MTNHENDFEWNVVCGHQDCPHTVTVLSRDWHEDASVDAQAAVIVCEPCYQSRRARWELLADAARFAEGGPPCALGLAGECSARVAFSQDLQLSVCLACQDANRRALREAERGYRPRAGAAPDLVPEGRVCVGEKDCARNAGALRALGVSRVLVCCDALPLASEGGAVGRWHRLPIKDSLEQDLGPYLPSALAFIAQGPGVALVHCNAGISRSGAIVCAHLASVLGCGFEEALALARKSRKISPNSAFVKQLVHRYPSKM